MAGNPKLDEIKVRLASPQDEVRGRAMQELSLWAKKDASVHEAALPIFQRAVGIEEYPWAAMSAARGIEHVVGLQAAREMWIGLMKRPNPQIVSSAALSVTDPFYIPALLDLLKSRSETAIQIAALRTLGRMKDPIVFDSIVQRLSIPGLCPDAIEALSDFDDPRAIPHLQPLVANDTDSGKTDDRGWKLRVGDLASDAIRRLSRPAQQRAAEARLVSHAPPPLPTRRRANLLAYAPLALALAEIPWFVIVLFQQLFRTGTITTSTQQTHRLDFVAALPALAGISLGVVVLFRWRRLRLAERICLVLGIVVCGLVAFPLVYEFFH